MRHRLQGAGFHVKLNELRSAETITLKLKPELELRPEGSGMVWENGLLVYRTGRPCPPTSLMMPSAVRVKKDLSIIWAIPLEDVFR